MNNDFDFGQEDNSNVLKTVLISCAIVATVLGVLSLLIFPSIHSKNVACETLEDQVKIARCEEKFKHIIFVIGDTQNTPIPSLNNEYASIIDSMFDGDIKKDISYISVSNPDSAPQTFSIGKKSKKTSKMPSMNKYRNNTP